MSANDDDLLPVWAREPRQKRGSRPGLDRDQIVKAAIELADAEGREALSIRRIAAKLNASPMALYWYVSSIDDVLDLAVDAVYGELPLPEPGGDWRTKLADLSHAQRALMRRHPWLTTVIALRALLGPNVLARTESTLALLAPLAGDMTRAMGLMSALNAYVTGFMLGEAAERETQRRTGLDEDAWQRRLGPFVEQHVVGSGRYPTVARYVLEAGHPSPDEQFAFGLERVLDGIAASL